MTIELRVLTSHMGELAAKQSEAAAAIASATAAVGGIGVAVASTHGPISSALAAAVTAAEQVRRTAGDRVEGQSRGMQQRLARAATSYQSTDESYVGRVGGMMHTRSEGVQE